MELKIRKKNSDLVLEFPDDLAQLPNLLKNFSGMLAEPKVVQALEKENKKLKEQIEALNSEAGLRARLAELGEEKFCRLGEELCFVEVVNEDQNKAAETADTLSESAAATPLKKIEIIR